jgi:hypothetical protein
VRGVVPLVGRVPGQARGEGGSVKRLTIIAERELLAGGEKPARKGGFRFAVGGCRQRGIEGARGMWEGAVRESVGDGDGVGMPNSGQVVDPSFEENGFSMG